MSSDVEIVNASLTLLGESRIMALDDDLKPAREANAIFTIVRDALLGSYNWNFAKKRAQLSALASAPVFGFDRKFQKPTDCLRLIQVGPYFVGIDLTDYRGSPTDEFMVEGREILTDMDAPLNVRYVYRVTDPAQFDASFTLLFIANLAEHLCEPLTQSNSKRDKAIEAKKIALREAIRANAIEMPPQKLADDEWILSRL